MEKLLSDPIAFILKTLRISVVIPASVLVGLSIVALLPWFESVSAYETLRFEESAVPVTVTFLIATALVSYALTVWNAPIIELFMGTFWSFSFIGNWLRVRKHRRLFRIQDRIQALDHKAEQQVSSLDPADKPNEEDRESKLINFRGHITNRNALIGELSWMYPHHQPWRVLPTRLGNVVASAQEHPSHLYGLDAVVFWPYLAPILDKNGYAVFVEREKSSLDFLLNMAIITAAFGIELVLLDVAFSRFNLLRTVLVMLCTGAIVFLFYQGSIMSALRWSHTYRIAFTLYRDQLRERLGLRQPNDFYDERNLWRKASRFYRDHDVTPSRSIFDYTAEGRKAQIAGREESDDTKSG
jgi:hypothetical protein